jgi:putative transposase
MLGVNVQAHIEEITPMALSDSALSELLDALRVGDGTDLVRELAQWALQQLIDAEAAEKIGAGRYERSDDRVTHRNGTRARVLSTKAGDLAVGIPKLRKGSFFPEALEPRRRIDQALYAVIMEAYVNGVSTRSVDDLVAAMGVDTGISKSEVPRICAGLDERVDAFRNRTLGHTGFPYVYLDATYINVRDDALGQVVSRAVVIATGITADGGREVLGVDIGDSEDETFWTRFLRSLRDRGPPGDLRRARRAEGLDPQVLHRGVLAAMPGPLRPEPPRHGPQGPPRDGLGRVPVDLRARHRHRGRGPLGRSH